MMSIRKIVTAAAVALGVAGGSQAFAWGDGGCKGPFCNQPRYPTLMAFMGHGHGNLPTFQAAPWYLYWPYDAHFLTPAPVRAPWWGARSRIWPGSSPSSSGTKATERPPRTRSIRLWPTSRHRTCPMRIHPANPRPQAGSVRVACWGWNCSCCHSPLWPCVSSLVAPWAG